MGNATFWVVIIAIGVYIYLRRKKKIPPIFSFKYVGIGKGASVINENNIVEEWSQMILGMGGKGEEFLKSVAAKLQAQNLPEVVFVRKEASLGQSNYTLGDKRYEFFTMRHERYPDYEMFIGAIDRAGQLKVSWYLTVALPGKIMGKLRAINKADRDAMPRAMRGPQMLAKTLGRKLAQKINEKGAGKPVPIRVRPEDMTMDDKEELGATITVAHNVVLAALEEMMNDLQLDFSKVDKHTEGFLNLS